jgi:hypothetical protein
MLDEIMAITILPLSEREGTIDAKNEAFHCDESLNRIELGYRKSFFGTDNETKVIEQ